MTYPAIYARYSSELQNDGYSIETQIEECKKALSRDDRATAVSYIDRAKSGTTVAGRPQLAQLMRDARERKISRLMVYKFDRLGRDVAETATTIRNLEEIGVTVCSATEGDNPLLRNMLLAFSEHFVRQLSERTHLGVIKAAEAGRVGGVAPYGYRKGADGRLVIDDETSVVVRRIFADYVTKGLSCVSIARTLNVERIAPPKGSHRRSLNWRASCIYEMIASELYMGRQVFNRRRFRRDRSTGKRVYVVRSKSEWKVLDRPDLAIVSKEVFQAAQKRRRERTVQSSRRRSYSLSGLVSCEDCGSSFVAAYRRKLSGRQYVYFECGNRHAGGDCGNDFRFREDLVTAKILQEITEQLLATERIEELKKIVIRVSLDRLSENAREREETGLEIAQIRNRQKAIMSLMIEAREKGRDGLAAWDEELQSCQARLSALEERNSALASVTAVDEKRLEALVDQAVDRYRKGLAQASDPEVLRETLRCVVGTVSARRIQHLTTKMNPVGVLSLATPGPIQLVAGVGVEPTL